MATNLGQADKAGRDEEEQLEKGQEGGECVSRKPWEWE
jgi:hypothetical protein